MVAELRLALVMAVDARLLVLDEPTLGLDILYRKAFYDSLLNDYFDHSRTIVISTHQVEEIQHILTDVVFIDQGRIVLDASMEAFEARYAEAMVAPGVALFGFFLSSFSLNRALGLATAAAGHPTKAGMMILGPYIFVVGAVIVVSFIVALVYSQGALHQERRDRSVLFWKSLPVSD